MSNPPPTPASFDPGVPFQEIDIYRRRNTKGKLVADIQKAQESCMVLNPFITTSSLRFLIDRSNDPVVEGAYDYEVLDAAESSGQEAFIAVSYRWEDEKGVKIPRVKTPYGGPNGKGQIRNARVAPHIINRAFRYANAHGIRKVWIDQECVDQDSKEDIQKGLDAMDLVYRTARYVIVLLQRHVKTSADAQGMAALFDWWNEKNVDIRERMFRDPWFERAWTVRELAIGREEYMKFLVGFEVDKPKEAGGEDMGKVWKKVTDEYNAKNETFGEGPQCTYGEWELSRFAIRSLSVHSTDQAIINTFWSGALSRSERGKTYILPEIDVEKLEGWEEADQRAAMNERETSAASGTVEDAQINQIFGILSSGNTPAIQFPSKEPPSPSSIGPLTRQTLDQYVLGSMEYILEKALYDSHDKLSILSNISETYFRLSLPLVKNYNLSFTACVIALALYNGDTSPLFGFGFPATTPINKRYANRSAYPSWLPPGEMCLNYLRTNAYQKMQHSLRSGRRSLVLDGNLVIQCLKWEITPFTDLIGVLDSTPGTTPLTPEEEVKIIFHHLYDLSPPRPDVVELLVTIILGYGQFGAPAEFLLTLKNLHKWHLGQKPTLPTKLAERIRSSDSKSQSQGYLSLTPLLSHIRNNHAVPIASFSPTPSHCPPGTVPPLAMFNISPDYDSNEILTPLSHLDVLFGKDSSGFMSTPGFSQSNWVIVPILPSQSSPPSDPLPPAKIHKARKALFGDDAVQSMPGVGRMHDTMYRVSNIVGGMWSPRLCSEGVLEPVDGSAEGAKKWELRGADPSGGLDGKGDFGLGVGGYYYHIK